MTQKLLRIQILPFLMLMIIGFAASAQSEVTYLHCGNLVDSDNMKVLKEMTVVVENAHIIGIHQGFLQPEDGGTVINLKNLTVMPGLIDMHVHLEHQTSPTMYQEKFTDSGIETAYDCIPFAEITLMKGFTTVRDLGGSGVNIALRDAINSGLVTGPRVITCGKSIATTGGHADPTNGFRRELMPDAGPKEGVADGVSQCREAVRWRYKNGADCIKITATGGVLSMAKSGDAPQFKQDELEAIVETAKDYGFHVAVHAHGAEGMRRAVVAGVKTIEHGTKMTEEVMDLMIEYNCYLVPTITAGKSVAEKAKIMGYYPEVVRPKALEIGPMIQDTFRKAYAHGVPVAFGTDASVFKHGDNWKEFVYMNEAGMPMLEIIRAATIIPAQILELDDKLGTIEEGKIADIIAVAGDPISNPADMEHVVFVMKEGFVVKKTP